MKEKILALFKKFSKRSINRKAWFGVDPYSDWRVLISIFTLVVMGIIYGGFYVWGAIDKGEIFKVPQTSLDNKETLNRESLDKVIEIFAGRTRQFTKIQNEGVKVSDPSI